MELTEFIQKFAEQFEETDLHVFTASTRFRELDEWSSIVGLGVLSMVGEEYGISMTPSDLKSANTIEEFYNIVLSKKIIL